MEVKQNFLSIGSVSSAFPSLGVSSFEVMTLGFSSRLLSLEILLMRLLSCAGFVARGFYRRRLCLMGF